MQTNEKKVWFPAKKYGWGWGFPCSWQGWVVLLLYLALGSAGVVLLATKLHPVLGLALGIAYLVLLSIIVFLIYLLKGEKPRWRWGKTT